jgi:hypothetical protein
MTLSKQQKTLRDKRLDSSEIPFYPYYAYNLKSNRILTYFDDQQICHRIKGTDSSVTIQNRERLPNGTIFIPNHNFPVDLNLLEKAIAQTKEGDTWKQFLSYCDAVSYHIRTYTEVEKLVGRIERPRIERENGNTNPKTFDFISVTINLVHQSDMQTKIKKHFSELKHMAAERIKKDRDIKRYGVPLSFLRLTSAKYSDYDCTITFHYELKIVDKMKT